MAWRCATSEPVTSCCAVEPGAVVGGAVVLVESSGTGVGSPDARTAPCGPARIGVFFSAGGRSSFELAACLDWAARRAGASCVVPRGHGGSKSVGSIVCKLSRARLTAAPCSNSDGCARTTASDASHRTHGFAGPSATAARSIAFCTEAGNRIGATWCVTVSSCPNSLSHRVTTASDSRVKSTLGSLASMAAKTVAATVTQVAGERSNCSMIATKRIAGLASAGDPLTASQNHASAGRRCEINARRDSQASCSFRKNTASAVRAAPSVPCTARLASSPRAR